MSLIQKLLYFIIPISLLPNKVIIRRYLKAGEEFGSTISPFGECIGIEKILDEWSKWENEYVKRGNKAIPLEVFSSIGYEIYEELINKCVRVKRDLTKKPIYYSEIYREEHLRKIKPAIDVASLIESVEPQFGVYEIPRTLGYRDLEEFD